MRPLLVTATLDPATQRRLDDLRARHFPPERNHLAAHLTLFHALPGDAPDAVHADIVQLAPRSPLPAEVGPPRLLGRGVAYRVTCPPLLAVRRDLAQRWQSVLTAQDATKRELHVTIQNKVTPERALALHSDLGADAWNGAITGIALWRYLGGPWEAVRTVAFGEPVSTSHATE